MNKTKIDWCDYTWNPVWGCRNNCPYCYARALAHRFGESFEPRWMEGNFKRALPKEPSRIFVNSMSEIAYWKQDWWGLVMKRIGENPQHKFLFLTKHPSVYQGRFFPNNCWLGVTITRQREMEDLANHFFESTWEEEHLLFLSIEPMLGPIKLYAIPDWIILGAETGNRKGRVIPAPDWIEPFVRSPIPLYMKHNLPWDGPWRKEFPLHDPQEGRKRGKV